MNSATLPAPNGVAKYDQVQSVRLDEEGMAKLKRVAKRNFLEPGTYARVVLMKHLEEQTEEDEAKGSEAAA